MLSALGADCCCAGVCSACLFAQGFPFGVGRSALLGSGLGLGVRGS